MYISSVVNANFYFFGLLLGSSFFLLLLLYFFRLKSNLTSLILWLTANLFSFLASAIITEDFFSPLIGMSINIFLAFLLAYFIPAISQFGAFLFTSMLLPSLLGIIWLYEITLASASYLDASLILLSFLLLLTTLFSLLIFLNSLAGASIFLLRFSELYFPFKRRDEALELLNKFEGYEPKVSIHLPCYEEPPEVVIQTLQALADLDYSNYEVIILDNNTKEESLWKPIQEYAEKLGEKFRFFHFDNIKGAKAGALNKALSLTDKNAEIIALIDADYIAEKNFLKTLAPLFKDPKIGFVQTCHDYRGYKDSGYQIGCYYEYAVHFKLELPALSEWDSAYTVGTMCLLRKKGIEEAGGWAEWCLTEDSEIAVRLHALGYEGYYFNMTLGRGLIPETFEEFKKQRFRWTVGPIQELKRYWRLYMPGSKNLKTIQKITEFFHGSALLLVELTRLFTIPILIGTLYFAFVQGKHFLVPVSVLWLIPIALIRSFGCNLISIKLLKGNFHSMLLASLAARALGFTRFQAVLAGALSLNLVWKRTNKFKVSPSFLRAFLSTKGELLSAAIYFSIAAFLIPIASFWPPDLIALLLLSLSVQGINYLCAPLLAFLAEIDLTK